MDFLVLKLSKYPITWPIWTEKEETTNYMPSLHLINSFQIAKDFYYP